MTSGVVMETGNRRNTITFDRFLQYSTNFADMARKGES